MSKPLTGYTDPRIVVTDLGGDYYTVYIAPPKKTTAPSLSHLKDSKGNSIEYNQPYIIKKQYLMLVVRKTGLYDDENNQEIKDTLDQNKEVSLNLPIEKYSTLTTFLSIDETATMISPTTTLFMNESSNSTTGRSQETIWINKKGSDYYVKYYVREKEEKELFIGVGDKSLISFIESIGLTVGLLSPQETATYIEEVGGNESFTVSSKKLDEFFSRPPKNKILQLYKSMYKKMQEK